MEKITKREMFVAIKTAMETGEACVYDADAVIAFCDKEIAALDNKAAKAKETAAKKKAESDELTDVIAALLTDELQTTADIAAKIEGEDVTVHKVSYRLTQLTKSGVAVKDEVSIPGKDGTKARKVVAYKLA